VTACWAGYSDKLLIALRIDSRNAKHESHTEMARRDTAAPQPRSKCANRQYARRSKYPMVEEPSGNAALRSPALAAWPSRAIAHSRIMAAVSTLGGTALFQRHPT
jgi:hypothetical protein